MAQNPIPPELQKLFNGTRPGQSPVPQMPTSAPLPVPTMGPTIASDPRAVPMMGEWEVRGAGAGQFPLGIPEDKLIPQPVTNTPQVTEGVRAGRAQQRRDQVGGVSAPTLTMQPSRAEQLQGVEAVPFSMTGGATRTEGRVGKNRPEIATPATVDAPSVFSDQPAGQMPTIDTPLPQPGQDGFRFAERGSPQDFFLSQTNDGTTPLSQEQIERGQAFAEERGMNFDPTTGFSTGTQAPATQGLTTQSGIPLAQFLSGGAIPEAGLAAESPLYSSESRGISGEAGQDIMAQESAARMAGTFSPAGAGRAVSDRERRMATGEGTSTADLTDMAKANAPGASPSDVARGQQVADSLGVDLKTGKPMSQEGSGLTDFQKVTAAQRQQEIDLKIQSGMEEKAAKQEVAFEESRNNVRATQDSFEKLKPVAEEIAALSGSVFTEGALGWAAAKLPLATDAGQIQRLTTEFEGSAFLQGLIEAKAKGATFGALSEQEGNRILGQWGTITSPDSTNPQRITAINNMLSSIQRSAERAASDHKEKFPNRSADAGQVASAPAQPSEGQVATSSGKTYTFK